MPATQKAIDEYLDALESAHGREYRSKTRVHHAGGANIALEYPDGTKTTVTVGRLDLMTEFLHQQASESRQAA